MQAERCETDRRKLLDGFNEWHRVTIKRHWLFTDDWEKKYEAWPGRGGSVIML